MEETNNKAELPMKKIKLIGVMGVCFALGGMATTYGNMKWLPVSIFGALLVYGYLKAHIESED